MSNRQTLSDKIKKRIIHDVDMMRGYYCTYEETPFIYHVYTDHHHLKVLIPKDYPFRSIRLNVVNKTTQEEICYVELYKKLISHYYRLIPELMRPGHCVCCDNIYSKWSPYRKMLNVIQEMYQYHQWWQELRSYYYAKKLFINNNNLNNDVIDYILQFLHVEIYF